MKLLSTEIDAETVQLTYTDGPSATEAKQAVILRLPLNGNLKRSLLRLQADTVEQAFNWLAEEHARLMQELKSN